MKDSAYATDTLAIMMKWKTASASLATYKKPRIHQILNPGGRLHETKTHGDPIKEDMSDQNILRNHHLVPHSIMDILLIHRISRISNLILRSPYMHLPYNNLPHGRILTRVHSNSCCQNLKNATVIHKLPPTPHLCRRRKREMEDPSARFVRSQAILQTLVGFKIPQTEMGDGSKSPRRPSRWGHFRRTHI